MLPLPPTRMQTKNTELTELNKNENRPLAKPAPAHHMQGISGTQHRNVHVVHEDSSTETTQQMEAGVRLGKRSNVSYVSLLIGGPAPEIEFNEPFWKKLGEMMRQYNHLPNPIWLISTSPRTPENVIKMLKGMENQSEYNIELLSIFTPNQPSILADILSMSRAIFVTGESVSMLADAFYFNVPTYAIVNENMRKHERIGAFLEQQEKMDNLKTINLDLEGKIEIPHHLVDPNRKKWSDYFWESGKTKML